MPGLVYLLCAATSLISGTLLLRATLARGGGLLLWSSLCFFGMGLSNVLLYINFVVLPDVDLTVIANLASLVSILMLAVALVWHST